MKIVALQIVLNFILIMYTLAQNDGVDISSETTPQNRRILSFQGGVSMPVGSFGVPKEKSTSYGFAKMGYHGDVNFGYQFKKHFGVLAMYRFQVNGVDVQALTKAMDHSAGTFKSYVTSMTAGQFSAHYASFGLSGHWTVFPRCIIVPRIATGISYLTIPRLTYAVKDEYRRFTFQYDILSRSNFAWCYSGGLTIQYDLKADCVVQFCIDYSHSVLNDNLAYANGSASISQSFATVSAGLSFGFRF